MAREYQVMFDAYTRIFTRLGLRFRAVSADTGAIGGSASHEFHVLAESGEDAIAFSDGSEYAANIEKAEAVAPSGNRPVASEDLKKISTPNQHSISEVSQFLNIPAHQCLKTLIVKSDDDNLVALLLRGDHELNAIKAEKITGIASPLTFANDAEIKQSCHCKPGSIGPINIGMKIIADRSALLMANFTCGANEDGQHYIGVNWTRDLPEPEQIEDLRMVVEGDPSPDGLGNIHMARGIEVGHIFQLGTKYSESMKAGVINEEGRNQTMIMGCYGIGISRVVASSIEQSHDAKGIIWPASLAPFQVAICPMNMHKSERLKAAAEQLYQDLIKAGIEVLFDDRKVRAGFMFSDMELIGIPHCIIISDRGLEAGIVEYKARVSEQNEEISIEKIVEFLTAKLSANEC